ncbi:hypothetical protein ABF87_08375 [Nitrosomonas sp. JL21]|nr:hypothetical protein [Nitrosomonas sp. JL21]
MFVGSLGSVDSIKKAGYQKLPPGNLEVELNKDDIDISRVQSNIHGGNLCVALALCHSFDTDQA